MNEDSVRVEMLGGPKDGYELTVASLVRLPDRLAFVDWEHGKRYEYRVKERTETFIAYQYERCEAFGAEVGA